MPRLKCKKCGAVFEQGISLGVGLAPHIGPYHYVKCVSCGKNGWFNIYSSVKDPVNFPSQEKKVQQAPEQLLSEEEQEKKRIEESKYERS
jgi:RNase P subunit RPR2